MGNLGGSEILWIIVVIALLFGAARIPQLMKGVGQGIKEFKQAVRDDDKPDNKDSAASGSSSTDNAPKT